MAMRRLPAQRLEQALHQSRAGLDRRTEQVLVVGVGAIAVDAQAVQRCNTLGGRQVAVRTAAGQTVGFQLEAYLAGDRRSLGEQLVAAGAAPKWRPVQAARHADLDVRIA